MCQRIRWVRPACLAILVAGVVTPGAARGQVKSPNQIEAPTMINVEDKDDIRSQDSKIWVLDFRFYSPRLITVDVPGRGRKLCWYMKYDVINRTKEPRTFIPDFELVTLDKPGVYRDEVLPKVEEAIRAVEDPAGILDFKNSVTIASKPIPVTKSDGPVRAVSGIAIWENDKIADANRFSIFVSGLSNGYSLAEIPPDNKQIVRRKTLQLNFKRIGDRYYQVSSEIQFVPPVEWTYRATTVTLDDKPAVKPAKATTRLGGPGGNQ